MKVTLDLLYRMLGMTLISSAAEILAKLRAPRSSGTRREDDVVADLALQV